MVGWGSLLGALACVVNGIAAGIMLATVIGVVPMMRALPYTGYVRMVQFMRPRFDPIMPLSNGTALVIDIVLVVAGQPGLGLRVCAAALLATVIAISVSKNVPVNRYVMALDADQPPDDWSEVDPRQRWKTWNDIRTSCAALAFLCNVAALLW